MTDQTYELRVNGVRVVELTPTASGTAAVMLATDVPSAGSAQRLLEFDPFASRYEIVHDGAAVLQTMLGGIAVGRSGDPVGADLNGLPRTTALPFSRPSRCMSWWNSPRTWPASVRCEGRRWPR